MMFKVALPALAFLAFADPSFAQSSPAAAQMAPPAVSGIVHLQGIGDSPLQNGKWAGTKGQGRRLEGFALTLANTGDELRLEYSCHLQDIGDIGPVMEGALCGTRGQSRRLEAFAISLTGPAAQFYTVRYACHLEGSGDTFVMADGEICGTRGQSRRLEAMRVWIEAR